MGGVGEGSQEEGDSELRPERKEGMSCENREELSRRREHRAFEAWSCREVSVAGRNPAKISGAAGDGAGEGRCQVMQGLFGRGEDCGDLNSQGSDLLSFEGLAFAAGGEWTAEYRLGARWRLFTPERLDGGLHGQKQEAVNLKCLLQVDQAGIIDGLHVGYEKKMDSGLWA